MNKLLSAAVLAVALPEEITFTTFKPQEAMMEFLDAHWVEIFGMGALVLGVLDLLQKYRPEGRSTTSL